MSLQLKGYVELPLHTGQGGFDHAAVHQRIRRLYVAHTANNAVDVIDCDADKYLHSISGLSAVAGALVSEDRDLVFTSNRGENTVGIFTSGDDQEVAKITTGVRPNGLSFDPQRALLLVANVGDPATPGSFTLTMIDVEKRAILAAIPVPGRTRWTIFDWITNAFYVNIADPAVIVKIDATEPTAIADQFEIPATGPHGMDIDAKAGRLFCACDAKKLVSVDVKSGKVVAEADLSGPPDVVFLSRRFQHLYVAIGDPGVIDVFDTDTMQRIEVVTTEKGAHTIGFDGQTDKVYAFLPETHRASVYIDQA